MQCSIYRVSHLPLLKSIGASSTPTDAEIGVSIIGCILQQNLSKTATQKKIGFQDPIIA